MTTAAQVETLGQQVSQYRSLVEQVIENLDTVVMPSEVRARKMFMDSLYMQVLQKLPEHLWVDFQEEFMRLIGTFRRRMIQDALHPPPSQAPPPPSQPDDA